MKPLSSTELAPVFFDKDSGEIGGKIRATGNKVAWIHSRADNPGAKFDLTIEDSLGRIKLQKRDCGNDTHIFGELVNLPTILGEELNVKIENVRGAKRVDLFLN